jgi:polysaccharide export outer membrane protein
MKFLFLRLLRKIGGPLLITCLFAPAWVFATPLISNLPFDLGWNAGGGVVQGPTPSVSAAVPTPTPTSKAPAQSSTGASSQAAKPVSVAPAVATAAAAKPVPALSIGAGDVLQVTVFGQPDMSAEVSVTDEGEVTLPLIGLLRIAGMSQAELEKLIAQRLREREYLLHPEVSVTVRQNRSQAVSVLGEVVRPGRYPIQGRFTVLDLLAVAGGLTPKADTVAVLLRKGEGGAAGAPVRIPIRLDRVANPDRSPLDLVLNQGDMVYVGQQKFFYIHGEVRRPGSYPMEPDLDVMRALSIGGGVTERGSMNRIQIHRKTEGTEARDFSPHLTDAVLDGDVIYVKERIF